MFSSQTLRGPCIVLTACGLLAGPGHAASALSDTELQTLLFGDQSTARVFDFDAREGTLVAEGVRYPSKTVPSETVLIDRLDASGLDTENIAHIFQSGSYAPGQTDSSWRKLFDQFSVTRITWIAANGDLLSIEKLEIDDLSMRQLRVSPDALSLMDLADDERGAMVLEAMQFDEFTLEGLNADSANDDLVTLQHVHLQEYDAGELKQFTMTGVDVADQEGDLAFASFAIEDLDVRNAIQESLSDTMAPENMTTLAQFDTMRFDNLTFSNPDDVKNLKINAIEISNVDYWQDIPLSTNAKIDGLLVRVDDIEDVDTRQTWKDLGYDQLSINLDYAGRYDPDTAQVLIDEFKVGADEVGSLNLSAIVQGVDLAMMVGQPNFTSLQSLKLSALELDYEDQSLMSRVYEQQGKREGVTASDYRSSVVQKFAKERSWIETLPNGPQNYAEVVDFLEDPRSLTLKANPAKPIEVVPLALLALMAPQMVLQSLNISVESNE